jgi:hypothetical protein
MWCRRAIENGAREILVRFAQVSGRARFAFDGLSKRAGGAGAQGGEVRVDFMFVDIWVGIGIG